MSLEITNPKERPPISHWIPLSFQHVFAMFGATILVPILTGLSPGTALLTSGLGTLIYIVITKGKVPAYLGSSFAFIAPLIAVSKAAEYGVAYAMGGAFCVGLFYILIALIIKFAGTKWIDRAMPPVVIGSVIMVIGLKLAPVAVGMSSNNAAGEYSLPMLLIAAVTLSITIVASIVLKGFFNVIPILIGVVGGYLFTLFMGFWFPAFDIIDFEVIKNAPLFGFIVPQMPKFHWVPIVSFLIVSFATIAEHMGDTMVLSRVVGKDFYKDPGLDRTLAGDGVATAVASLLGGPPNTTYGENIGVMAITKVYSVWVTGGAAVIAIVLSFFGKFSAILQTIPTPVMGGISLMLFGIIASAGIRTVVESGVNYGEKRNLAITSVILVLGIGGGMLKFPIGSQVSFELAGVALATLVGIILNLLLPRSLNDIPEETAEEMILDDINKKK